MKTLKHTLLFGMLVIVMIHIHLPNNDVREDSRSQEIEWPAIALVLSDADMTNSSAALYVNTDPMIEIDPPVVSIQENEPEIENTEIDEAYEFDIVDITPFGECEIIELTGTSVDGNPATCFRVSGNDDNHPLTLRVQHRNSQGRILEKYLYWQEEHPNEFQMDASMTDDGSVTVYDAEKEVVRLSLSQIPKNDHVFNLNMAAYLIPEELFSYNQTNP